MKIDIKLAFGNEDLIKIIKREEQREKKRIEAKKAPICDSRYVEILTAQAQFKCNFCKNEMWEEFEGDYFEEHRKCPECGEWLKLRANA